MYNNQIERYLKARGFTKKHIAEKMGMSGHGFAEAIRNGSIKLKDLYKLADILEVSLIDILGLQEKDDPGNSASGKNIMQNSNININANKLEIEILRTQISNHQEILKNKDTIITNLGREITNLHEIIGLLKK